MQALENKVHQQEVNLLNFKLKQIEEQLLAAKALNFNMASGALMHPPHSFMPATTSTAQSQSLRLEYTTQAVNQQS